MSVTTSEGRGTRLCESHVAPLVDKLAHFASKWKDIGLQLGFTQAHLDTIEASLPGQGAQRYLAVLLSEWVRGKYATLENLKEVLHRDAVGLGSVADDLNFEQRIMVDNLSSGHNESDQGGGSSHESMGEGEEKADKECLKWKRGRLLRMPGAYVKVWEGLMDSGKTVAVKEVHLRHSAASKNIQSEVEILLNLKHKNIVCYVGANMENNTAYIFMELISRESLTRLLERGSLATHIITRFTRQITEALDYLHSKNFMHRNIKGSNIMVTSTSDIKLVGFSWVTKLCEDGVDERHSMVGTAHWMAPEIIHGEKYGTKVDIWSLGCTVYEMATTKPPWADLSTYGAVFMVGAGKPIPSLPDHLSQKLVAFIYKCLIRDPQQRPSASELLKDEFLNEEKEGERKADEKHFKWKRGRLLGKGAYGKVWEGLMDSGEKIAVREVELDYWDLQNRLQCEKIQTEVKIVSSLSHKNVVRYLGTSVEMGAVIYVFMEFILGESVRSILNRLGALDCHTIAHYTRQITEALEYLHSNKYMHRDIKGSNIMVMPTGDVKLVGFAYVKEIREDGAEVKDSMPGAPYWMAPEIIRDEVYGTKVDIWSLGGTVHEMATTQPPWADLTTYAAIFYIGTNTTIPPLPDHLPKELIVFINRCLASDPMQRPSANELTKDEFLATS